MSWMKLSTDSYVTTVDVYDLLYLVLDLDSAVFNLDCDRRLALSHIISCPSTGVIFITKFMTFLSRP